MGYAFYQQTNATKTHEEEILLHNDLKERKTQRV